MWLQRCPKVARLLHTLRFPLVRIRWTSRPPRCVNEMMPCEMHRGLGVPNSSGVVKIWQTSELSLPTHCRILTPCEMHLHCLSSDSETRAELALISCPVNLKIYVWVRSHVPTGRRVDLICILDFIGVMLSTLCWNLGYHFRIRPRADASSLLSDCIFSFLPGFWHNVQRFLSDPKPEHLLNPRYSDRFLQPAVLFVVGHLVLIMLKIVLKRVTDRPTIGSDCLPCFRSCEHPDMVNN